MSSLAWFAVAVAARKEKAAARELGRRGLEVFLPLRAERRRWSDRIQQVELALFPGYLFLRMDPAARVEVLRARHVDGFVGQPPAAIPDAEIDSLRILLASERALDPIERLVRGTRVAVAAGPLRGAIGVVESGPDRRRRLCVQIELLGRGVRAELFADDVIDSP